MIYFTSDLHLQHDREFLYGPRGFKTIDEHDKVIIKNINDMVGEDDELYILGDLMLNDIDKGIEEFNSIKCKNIHVIFGNHDTENKIKRYKKELPNVNSFGYANIIKNGKHRFYISHFPTYTGNLENGHLNEQLLNLYGHIHSKEKFFQDRPYMYNVALDANDNKPISIDDILDNMREKKQECLNML